MRLIDADELIKMLQDTIDFNMKHNTFFKSFSMQHILYILENMKTVDLVKHGEWINIDAKFENMYVAHQCSICKSEFLGDASNFCPRCGAKMDGNQNGN